MNSLEARVFVSMGQAMDEEKQVRDKILEILRGFGFDPYAATLESDASGLLEPILRRLAECEYYIFIDYYRETLPNRHPSHYPFKHISLFTHQELAVAAALKKQGVLVFRDSRLGDERVGMAAYMQLNAQGPFNSDTELLMQVEESVRAALMNGSWKNNWRNELSILDPQYRAIAKKKAYHMIVRNNHYKDSALQCGGYMTAVMKNGKTIEQPFVELKWAFVQVLPYVNILPMSERKLDAFVIHEEDDHFELGRNDMADTDQGKLKQMVDKMESATFNIDYQIDSLNLPVVKARATIEFRPGKSPTYKIE